MKGPRWSAVDYAAVVLSLAIAMTLASSTIRMLTSDLPLDAEKSKLLSGLIGSVIAIISVWVGSHRKNDKD